MTKGWPDNFDVRNDPVFEERIRPFIENQLAQLKIYDRQRQAQNPDITYIFHEHAERVAQDAKKTCAHMGLPENVQENMYWAMLVHDLGKYVLPIEIWDLPGKPTDEESKFRRSHVDRGIEIVENELGDLDHPFIDLMKDIIANHHERMDGKGEHKMMGENISMPVRLACIIESFDGYRTRRPHFGNRDLSPAAVLEKMRSEPKKGAAMFDMELFERYAETKAPKPAAQTDDDRPVSKPPRR